MRTLLLILLLIPNLSWAVSSGWYSTLQGNNSDVQSGNIPDGSTLQYSASAGQWQFSYATVPSGGSTGYVLTKNSNSNYDYSWQPSSGGGSGNVGIGTTTRIPVYIGTTTIGSPYNNVMDGNGNVGIGVSNPTVTLDINNPNSAGYLPVMNMFATSNTGGGNATEYRVGVANSTGNSAEIRYVYQGSNNSSNRIDYSMNGNVNAAISYDNNLNVGINNQSPGYRLDVNGTIRTLGMILTNNVPSTTTNTLYNNGGTLSWNGSAVGGGSILTPNVGIGTSSPSGILDVEGTLSPAIFFANTTQNVGIGTSIPKDYLNVISQNSGGLTIGSIGGGIGGIDANTSLMLHFNNNLTDYSNNNYSVTNSGVTFSSSVFKFSQYPFSGVFNGSANLVTPSALTGSFGTSDFEMDMWVNTTQGAGNAGFISDNHSSTTGVWKFFDPAALQFGIQGLFNDSFGVAVNDGNWHLIEVDRHAGVFYYFADGNLKATDSSFTGSNCGVAASTMAIGVNVPDSASYIGNIDELRITVGTFRHTTSYTPPTSPYTNLSISSPQLTLASMGTQTGFLSTNGNSSNVLQLGQGSTAAITITSSENVGIGTATPGQVLDINGNERVTGTNQYIFGSDNANYINNSASSSGDLTFNTNSLERMRIGNGGGVGIGTTKTTTAALTVMNGNVGIGTWVPGASLSFGGACKTSGIGQDVCWGTSTSGAACIGYCTAGTFPACSSCTCC